MTTNEVWLSPQAGFPSVSEAGAIVVVICLFICSDFF
jgi:hypothetical protein